MKNRLNRIRGHKLFTNRIIEKLKSNAQKQRFSKDHLDLYPVVKIFNPYGHGMWFFTELEDDGRLFGLCDIGYPELGYASVEELETLTITPFKLPLERDLYFTSSETLSAQLHRQQSLGRI